MTDDLAVVRERPGAFVERYVGVLERLGMVPVHLPADTARLILSQHQRAILRTMEVDAPSPDDEMSLREIGDALGRADVPLALVAAGGAALPGVLRSELTARGIPVRRSSADYVVETVRLARALRCLFEGWEQGDAVRKAAGGNDPLRALLEDLLAGRVTSAGAATRISLAGLPQASWYIGLLEATERPARLRPEVTAARTSYRGNVAWLATVDEPFEGHAELLGGVSARVASRDLPRAAVQATLAFAAARRTGVTQSWGGVGFDDGLAEHPSLLEAAAERLLAPLDPSLRATLEAFARRWPRRGAAAEDLAIHRNTFARRLSTIERELHVDLSDPDVLVQLHLATQRRNRDKQ